MIAPATGAGTEQRYWRGEEGYSRTPPPPDAEYVPLVVRDPINRLEVRATVKIRPQLFMLLQNLASGVEKSSWSRARIHARTLYRQLKQGIPLFQALPATSAHLRLVRVYPTLQARFFDPRLIDQEILGGFHVRCFKMRRIGTLIEYSHNAPRNRF